MGKTLSLPYTAVDSHSPIPLYHQIYLDLRQMIQREILSPGDTLPPELDICEAYGVGRQTVRQAIARLVDENMVERFAGRGTFVRSKPSFVQFFLDRSFSQQMREMGFTPHSRVLSKQNGVVEVDIPALQAFKGETCLTLERLRLGSDVPICHQISTILTQRCPGIEQFDFSGSSLYETLATHYHLNITRIDHVVRAIATDDYRADLLHVEEETPLLYVGTSTFLEGDELVEFSSSYYPGDRYDFRTTQTCCAD